MRQHPIVWFYTLAFGVSWFGSMLTVLGSRGIAPFDNAAVQPLVMLAAFGPALAAVIVTRVAYGATALPDLLKALIQWRVGALWYLVAVVGPLGLLLVGQGVTTALGVSTAEPEPQADLFPVAVSALVVSLLSNPWEELGWRGFALPHLQKRHSALVATLVVGVLWALWHLPLFFWRGNPMAD